MTNEEKANEIARCDCQKHYKGFDLCNTYKFHEKNYCGRKAAALEAMEWKDEQFETEKQALINKACEFISKHADEYVTPDEESYRMGCGVDYFETNMFIEDFKNYMKGGEE